MGNEKEGKKRRYLLIVDEEGALELLRARLVVFGGIPEVLHELLLLVLGARREVRKIELELNLRHNRRRKEENGATS